jgi:hypothetical protein
LQYVNCFAEYKFKGCRSKQNLFEVALVSKLKISVMQDGKAENDTSTVSDSLVVETFRFTQGLNIYKSQGKLEFQMSKDLDTCSILCLQFNSTLLFIFLVFLDLKMYPFL